MIEYLKNIFISFLEAPDQESVIPAICQVLHLDEQERSRVKKSFKKPSILGIW